MARDGNWEPKTAEEKLDYLMSVDQIKQLPHRYGLAVDSRNMDDLVELFVDDVRVGNGQGGRAALKEWYTTILSTNIRTSIHFIGNHVIDFQDADHASGVTYCRDELERDADWGVGYIQYWDKYVRRNGRWYFRKRNFYRWFMVDALQRPAHGAGCERTDDALPVNQLPEAWPSWGRYWQEIEARKARG
ncbi:MAG: nuclear transport factor 2 family protein [Gammaproteobacteria bacterium]